MKDVENLRDAVDACRAADEELVQAGAKLLMVHAYVGRVSHTLTNYGVGGEVAAGALLNLARVKKVSNALIDAGLELERLIEFLQEQE